jgi:hypothetical protein
MNHDLFESTKMFSDAAYGAELLAKYAAMLYSAFIKHGFDPSQALSLTMHQIAVQQDMAARAAK